MSSGQLNQFLDGLLKLDFTGTIKNGNWFMRVLIVVLKVLVLIALCGDLLLWLAAHASGHKIPSKTDWSFGITSILLLILLLALVFIGRKK